MCFKRMCSLQGDHVLLRYFSAIIVPEEDIRDENEVRARIAVSHNVNMAVDLEQP